MFIQESLKEDIIIHTFRIDKLTNGSSLMINSFLNLKNLTFQMNVLEEKKDGLDMETTEDLILKLETLISCSTIESLMKIFQNPMKKRPKNHFQKNLQQCLLKLKKWPQSKTKSIGLISSYLLQNICLNLLRSLLFGTHHK